MEILKQESLRSSTTCFEKAVEFNYSFGVLKSLTLMPKYDIYFSEPSEIKNAVKLILEEYNEYVDAVKKYNLIEMVDALIDISYVVHGMCARMGINFDNIYSSLLDFKMSKLNKECKTQTNFERTAEFNKIFEETYQHVLYDGFSLSFLTEIITQFNNAIEKKNFDNTLNSLLQIEYYVNSKMNVLNINMDDAYDIVHKNNMSKLCITEEEAKLTVEKHKQNFDSPNYRKTTDGKYWIVYNKSTNKILKSINYKPVDLTEICKKKYIV